MREWIAFGREKGGKGKYLEERRERKLNILKGERRERKLS